MAVLFVWWRGGFGALFLGIGGAWFVDFAAGFRAAARVPFLASPRKGTKRRGTLTPGPAGSPALLSRAGRLRNSGLKALRQSSPKAPRPPCAARRGWKGMNTQRRFYSDWLRPETSPWLCKRRFSGRVRKPVFQPAEECLVKPGRFIVLLRLEPTSGGGRTVTAETHTPQVLRHSSKRGVSGVIGEGGVNEFLQYGYCFS